MLADHDGLATVAVRDFAAAQRFYGETLGLAVAECDDDSQVATYRSGGSSIVVYRSEFAGTNRATSLTWGVGEEFDAIVAALAARGVPFEHYDLPGMTRAGDVHAAGDFKAAWFRDPDGNILHVNNM
jgi:catechol 2,3-dioxygenase-like lactoylglutathione lyase family enzyme